jgi:predicted DNA-binding ribbon-helix-helix protein
MLVRPTLLPVRTPLMLPELTEADLIEVINFPVKKRSVVIGRHKTSISVEDPFWSELRKSADRRQMTLCQMLGRIDGLLPGKQNLSSALRLYTLAGMRAQIAALTAAGGTE